MSVVRSWPGRSYVKKSKLAEKVKRAQKGMYRTGIRPSIEVHARRKEIEDDIREVLELRKSGKRISIVWLAETHFLEEYGLEIGREAVRRYAKRHLGITL